MLKNHLTVKKIIKNILIYTVLKTNKYWPFSYLNKLPYKIAVKLIVDYCRKFSEIKTIYAVGSFAAESYIPGISDIDLVFIFSSSRTIEDDFNVLCLFWRRYFQIKRLFPILTHMIIYFDRHTETWTKIGIEGYEMKSRKLLLGRELADLEEVSEVKTPEMRSINYAISCYLNRFLKSIGRKTYGRNYVLQRLCFKIIKSADPAYMYFNSHEKQEVLLSFADNTDMLGRIVNKLECGIRDISIPGTRLSGSIYSEAAVNGPADDNIFLRTYGITLEKFDEISGYLESVTALWENTSSFMLFIILKDRLGEIALKKSVSCALQVFKGLNRTPVISTYNTFKYILRSYDPLIHVRLIRKRTVLYGRDLIPEMEGPSKHIIIYRLLACALDLEKYFLNTRTFNPYFHDIDLNIRRERLGYYLEAYIIGRLLAEENILPLSFIEALSEFGKYNTKSCGKIKNFINTFGYDNKGILHIDCYALLVDILNEIYDFASRYIDQNKDALVNLQPGQAAGKDILRNE